MRHPSVHRLDRERKHDGRAALTRDIEQGREITQLHRLRHRRQNLGGVEQLLRRLLLSLRVDGLGAAGAVRLRLAGELPARPPSAVMILARRVRSASAWRAIARIMLSSRSMRLISTVDTLIPHPSVCLSSTSWIAAVSFF